MKLNELKQPKNEAIDWSPLVGHYGQSFIGDRPAGADREGQIAKQIFVRNFMLKAASGLESAINSGLVDPNAVSSVTPTPNSDPFAAKRAAGAANAQANMKANPPPVKPVAQNAQSVQPPAANSSKPITPVVPKARGGRV